MKIFNWLRESNRLSHLKFGFAIFVLMMLLGCSILSMFEEVTSFEPVQVEAITFTCSLLSTISVFIAMCAVEYTQKTSGIGKWDWLDILAGCLIPVLITIIVLIVIAIL